jgi:hypothetical protein
MITYYFVSTHHLWHDSFFPHFISRNFSYVTDPFSFPTTTKSLLEWPVSPIYWHDLSLVVVLLIVRLINPHDRVASQN